MFTLSVGENGIYFSYRFFSHSFSNSNGENLRAYEDFSYYLPFGATEPIEDTRWNVRKGIKEYYVGGCTELGVAFYSREMQEDGTRERIEILTLAANYCVIENCLYSVERRCSLY